MIQRDLLVSNKILNSVFWEIGR